MQNNLKVSFSYHWINIFVKQPAKQMLLCYSIWSVIQAAILLLQASHIRQLVYDYQEVILEKSVNERSPSPLVGNHIGGLLDCNDDSDEHL